MVIWRGKTNSKTVKNIKMDLWHRGRTFVVVKEIKYDGMK
jgi:hypothetical protein